MRFTAGAVRRSPNPWAYVVEVTPPLITKGVIQAASKAEVQQPHINQVPAAMFDVPYVASVFVTPGFITVMPDHTHLEFPGMDQFGVVVNQIIGLFSPPSDIVRSVVEKLPKPKGLVVTRTTPIHSFKVDATWNSLIQASVSSLLETDIAPVLAQDGGGLELLSVEVHATPRMGRPDYQHYRVTIRYQGACGSCASSTSGTLEAIENFLVEMVHDDIVVVSA